MMISRLRSSIGRQLKMLLLGVFTTMRGNVPLLKMVQMQVIKVLDWYSRCQALLRI